MKMSIENENESGNESGNEKLINFISISCEFI